MHAAIAALSLSVMLVAARLVPHPSVSAGSDPPEDRIVLAQFMQRVAREERTPARREAREFSQTTRTQDAQYRQEARADVQQNRRVIWDFESKFRNEQRETVRERTNQTRGFEQVIRNDRADFNLAQTRERQALRGATAEQRREQTLRISSEVRQRNVELQKANRERIEAVREQIRSELEEIRRQVHRPEG